MNILTGKECDKMKPNKYHAIKTTIDGKTFDSKKESLRYNELKILEKAGEISELVLQPEFILQDAFKKNGKKYRPIIYRADFKYKEKGHPGEVVEDVKGVKTKDFMIKQKLFEARFPDLTLRLV